jgi:hypothetical protein
MDMENLNDRLLQHTGNSGFGILKKTGILPRFTRVPRVLKNNTKIKKI